MYTHKQGQQQVRHCLLGSSRRRVGRCTTWCRPWALLYMSCTSCDVTHSCIMDNCIPGVCWRGWWCSIVVGGLLVIGCICPWVSLWTCSWGRRRVSSPRRWVLVFGRRKGGLGLSHCCCCGETAVDDDDTVLCGRHLQITAQPTDQLRYQRINLADPDASKGRFCQHRDDQLR